MTKAKPFVKWAGGKRELIDTLDLYLPESIDRYHEPFVGGGALLFHIGARCKEIYISDLNFELITTYSVIKEYPHQLLAALERHKNEEEYFYQVRSQDPEKLEPVEVAARFIFLNKTAYNGLYRVNQKGEFNAPFGNYVKPNYQDLDNIIAVHLFLNQYKVHIQLCSFERTIGHACSKSFYYFDPPYIPLNKTSFIAYNKKRFTMEDQVILAKMVKTLAENGISSISSNSGSDLFPPMYSTSKLISVGVSRNINSNGEARKKVKEYLALTGPFFANTLVNDTYENDVIINDSALINKSKTESISNFEEIITTKIVNPGDELIPTMGLFRV